MAGKKIIIKRPKLEGIGYRISVNLAGPLGQLLPLEFLLFFNYLKFAIPKAFHNTI